MDLDTPIPAPIFANRPFKLSYLRFASFIIIAAILALFLVSHKSPRQPDPIPFFRTASFEFVCLFSPCWTEMLRYVYP
jgi:hypothetical protein